MYRKLSLLLIFTGLLMTSVSNAAITAQTESSCASDPTATTGPTGEADLDLVSEVPT